jgi:Gamma-glutamyl cyclotransferase, AIG2-like
MVPAILHRIIHGSPTPEPWQKALITTRPAVLPGYRRYRVRGADYPGILESSSSAEGSVGDASVLGVVVTGLTEGDVLRLDTFEGSEYTKRAVTVRVAKSTTSTTGSEAAEGHSENAALQRGLAETAHLADTETEDVEATTYVWTDPESSLELDSEWDFESFKRDKLQWWIDAPESEL